jgi:serine/threonine protein phosphatase PrpC
MVDMADTQELPTRGFAGSSTPVDPPQPVGEEGLLIGKCTDVGQVRDHNEDSFFIFNSMLHGHQGVEKIGLFVVADGMGGHEQGEAASILAAKVAAGEMLHRVCLPIFLDDRNATPINEALLAAVEAANVAVIDQVPDGGTTLVVALVLGNNAYIAYVGDSRAYVYHNSVLKASYPRSLTG